MLSRVANAIYWMNRYVERAENGARTIDVGLHVSLDAGETQWKPIVETGGDEALFAERYSTTHRHDVIQFLAFDDENPNSIVGCLTRARENARTVREIISSEMWEQVNTLYLMLKDAQQRGPHMEAPHEFFSLVKQQANQFVGTTYLTMTHNEAWHFGKLGRLFERADSTSRIIDVKYYYVLPSISDVGSTYDELHWVALLKSASAFEMYRKRHARILPQLVVDFLLREPEFPRSVRYTLCEAEKSLATIVADAPKGLGEKPVQLLGQLSREITQASTEEIIAKGLHEYLDELQSRVADLGDAVHEAFFTMKSEM